MSAPEYAAHARRPSAPANPDVQPGGPTPGSPGLVPAPDVAFPVDTPPPRRTDPGARDRLAPLRRSSGPKVAEAHAACAECQVDRVKTTSAPVLKALRRTAEPRPGQGLGDDPGPATDSAATSPRAISALRREVANRGHSEHVSGDRLDADVERLVAAVDKMTQEAYRQVINRPLFTGLADQFAANGYVNR